MKRIIISALCMCALGALSAKNKNRQSHFVQGPSRLIEEVIPDARVVMDIFEVLGVVTYCFRRPIDTVACDFQIYIDKCIAC